MLIFPSQVVFVGSMFAGIATAVRGYVWERRELTSLDLLGAYYADNVNDGLRGNVRKFYGSCIAREGGLAHSLCAWCVACVYASVSFCVPV